MPTPPALSKPVLVDRVQLAALLGKHPDAISKLTKLGMPVHRPGRGGREGVYDAIECLTWYRAHQAPRGKDLEQERLYKAQADKIEQEIRKRTGETVELAEVETAVSALVVAFKERMLALPTTAGARGFLAPGGDDGVHALVHEALAELAARGPGP